MRSAIGPCALAVLFGVFSQAGPLHAQEPDPKVPLDPAIVAGTLDNGLRYFIRANARPEDRAELRLVVRVGSVLEDEDQLGLAHFVEHMAFNGTEHFAKQELVNHLESFGMRLGPDLNAYTSFDETVYMLQVPTDTAGLMETAFQILADWAVGIAFEGEEIEKERGVVIEEWRLGRGAGARIRDKQFPIIFEGSRYADRLPIGKKETLEGFAHETLVRYYRDWYRPELMAVVAVGDFDTATIEALIREHFAPIPASGPDVKPRPTFEVPDHTEPRFAIATDPEATNSSVGVLFKQTLRDHTTVAAYRQDLVERLFSRMLNMRLYELSQQADPPFVYGGAGQGRFIGAGEVFQLYASVRSGGITRGLEAVLREAERVMRHGFTVPELERAKAEVLRQLEQADAERDKTESWRHTSGLVQHALEGDPVPGPSWELAQARQQSPGITLDETNRLASEWITEHNRVVVADAPDQAGVSVPSGSELAGVFATVVAGTIDPYVETLSDAPLVADVPTPSSVVREDSAPEVGITFWTLANGVDVILKPTDFKDDEVVFRASSPGGYSLAQDDNWLSGYYSDWIIDASGVGEFRAVDLTKVLAGKAVRVSPLMLELEEGFSGRASPRDLETAFQLIYLYMTAPRMDTAGFLATREQLAAGYENRSASPDAAFYDTLRVTLAQHHPRELPLTLADIEALDLDEAMAFYRERYADASDFTFIVVGSFTLDSIRPLVEQWLGGLPNLGRVETWRDLGIDPPTGVITRTVRKGIEQKSRTEIVFSGPWEDSRQRRYDLRALGEALQFRLREVLREDLGGTYGVSVRARSEIRPDSEYGVRVSFGTDPERLTELTDVVFAEIKTFQEAGPADSIVQKVREGQRRSREVSLKENSYWLGQIWASLVYPDFEWATFYEYDQLIDTLTAARIRNAAQRWLRLDNYVQVSLVPEGAVP